MKKSLFVLALLLAQQGWAADPKPDLQPVADPKPILAALQQKMSALHSVYLEFTQERQLKLFAAPLKSEGVMLIDRPGLIRWETSSPYQSIMLGNQKSVAQFEFNDGKWNKLKLGFSQALKQVMDQMTLMHQGKLDALTSDYTLSVSTGAVTVVTMVPKDENIRSLLAALEIHFPPDLATIQAVVMREPGDDYTRITFNREIRNPKYPANTFDQAKPLDLTTIKTAVIQSP
jgi:outer membrane lipoprotein-sorting protein